MCLNQCYYAFPLHRMAFFRQQDRMNNVYPAIDYSEMYLLKGGYKQFYTDCPVCRCVH